MKTAYKVTYFDEEDCVVDTTEIDDNDEDFAWELFAEFGHIKTDKHSLTIEPVQEEDDA